MARRSWPSGSRARCREVRDAEVAVESGRSMPRARPGPAIEGRDQAPEPLARGTRATTRTPPRRHSYRRRSTASVLECLAHHGRRELGEVTLGDGDDMPAPTPEPHGGGRHRDLEASVPSDELDLLAALQAQRLSQRLWHHYPPRSVDRRLHGATIPDLMAPGWQTSCRTGTPSRTRPCRRAFAV